MKVMVIASGSKGNCTYIETDEHKILIDVGVSHKRIKESLSSINVQTSEITDIFITHEHTDHIGGLYSFCSISKSNARLHFTNGTLYAILNNKYKSSNNVKLYDYLEQEKDKIVILKCIKNIYETITYKNLFILPVTAFHDAMEPVGYVVYYNNKKVVYLTDTGYVHSSIFDIISNADCYIFECNHDPEILMNSDRPYELKKRILSNHGHLSNEDGLYVLAKVMGVNTKHVFYAHISQECNLVELIDITRRKLFKEMGLVYNDCNFEAAKQDSHTLIEI